MANIKLNNKEYTIPDSVFAAAKADFVAHLGTIAGNGLKVVVGGVEYGVDAAKVAGAVAGLEGTFGELEPVVLALAPGLYQPGAIALWQAGDVEAASAMLVTSWGDLEANGIIAISEGEDIELPEMNEYGFYFGVPYSAIAGDVTIRFTFNEDGSAIFDTPDGPMEIPVGAVIYGDHSIDMTVIDMPVLEVSPDGTQIEVEGTVFTIGSGSILPKGTVYLPNLNIYDPISIIEGDLVLPNDGSAKELVPGCFVEQGLTDIFIPNSITNLGPSVFSGCTKLTSVVMPNNVTTIGTQAFYNCSELTSIVIPDSVTFIGDSAFDACSNLTSIAISNSVTTIGEQAFSNCSSLTSIVIPDGVTSIKPSTFWSCDNLASIVIPNSVTSIKTSAFAYCRNLTSITFDGTMVQWKAITKSSGWNINVPATHVHCLDGDITL